jgi:hypothetical protein
MPLYLDDFEPPDVPDDYLRALLRIAKSASDQPVNPATAANLLRTFVMPLLAPEHQSFFMLSGAQPSWDRLYLLYANLAGASGGRDPDLLAAATLVDRVIRHTTSPPRGMSFPPHLELASFERVVSYLGLPAERPTVQLGGHVLRLYDFCRYCWLPAGAKGVCRQHSTRRVEVTTPLCGAATLKQVQRLAPQFAGELTRLVSSQEWEFHESNFSAPILLPPSGLRAWLEHRRPALAALLDCPTSKPARTLESLLSFLYGDDGGRVMDEVAASVYLLTPITCRAEAWCRAWNNRNPWGGARAGAGRLPR